MAQSTAPPMDPMYEPSAIDNFDNIPHPAWEQYWTIGQPNFPGSSEAFRGNVQHEHETGDFISNYAYTPATTNLTSSGSIFSQGYPTPPRTSELTSPENPPSNSDGRRRSSSMQLDNQKRKPTRTKRDLAKSSGRDFSKQVKAKRATGDVHGDIKRGGSIYKAAERDLSSLQHVNNEHTRKHQERNRRATNKFRNRKREDQRNLESAEKDMEQVNRDLSTCATDLKNQVYNLKMKLLQHTDCDCTLIQEYIANNANRYIQTLVNEGQC
ncbi:hypothetical protein FSARC_14012 [Fusarium sarcochroum]|uniref:BZIP domain-containing protein n=1 Tax=Fusarium sarcochroum TaxID=1208366 RepID=A0A8H4SX54_9HYPO|nr:hypothetical protein FSARC_14012 [Fusarium sarcochroum]